MSSLFADRLQQSIARSKGCIVAGFDPQLVNIPRFFSQGSPGGAEEAMTKLLVSYYDTALEEIGQSIAAIKPNIAFFEQHGLGGLRALRSICDMAKQYGIPVIMDAKRGDIGSTAKAYSAAYLGKEAAFPADALTVNPFLGFDTLEPYLEDCRANGKGMFVLAKTSNPGSRDLQGDILQEASTASERVAEWIANNGADLRGASGYSGLGAVVGATHPAEAKRLREIMPDNLFLVPGVGPQGGTIKDAMAGADSTGGGVLIVVSRALFTISEGVRNPEEFKAQLRENLTKTLA